MMPLYTEGVAERDDVSQDELGAGFGEYAGNLVGQWWSGSLSPMLLDAAELELTAAGERFGEFAAKTTQGAYPGSVMLSKQTALDYVSRQGVDVSIPEEGIGSRTLDLLIERRREEARRAAMMERPHSGAATAAGHVAGFLSGVADPLNLATASIPILGEARFAQLLGRSTTMLGRAGVRAGIRGTEAGLATAAIEPARYAAAQALQDDYTLTDSLLNVTLGGAFGGGLHAVGGAARDFFHPGVFRREVAGAPGAVLPERIAPAVADVELKAAAGRLTGDDLEHHAQAPEVQGWMQGLLEQHPERVKEALREPVADLSRTFQGGIPEARQWALDNLRGTYKSMALGGRAVSISRTLVEKALSESAAGRSPDLGAHVDAIQAIPQIIRRGHLIETTADKLGSKDITAIHRIYGVVNRQGQAVGVKLTVKGQKRPPDTAYTYQVVDIEAPAGLLDAIPPSASPRAGTSKPGRSGLPRSGVSEATPAIPRGEIVPTPIARAVARLYGLPAEGSAAHLIGSATPETREAAFRAFAAQALAGHVPDVEPVLRADRNVQLVLEGFGEAGALDARAAAERIRRSDRLAGDPLPDPPRPTGDLLAEAKQLRAIEMQRLSERLAARPELYAQLAELQPQIDQVTRADLYVKALHAAANCGGSR